jgi:hypothetical protein
MTFPWFWVDRYSGSCGGRTLKESYALVRDMHPIPFGLDDITRLAAATAAPVLPLLLTIFSPEELVMRVFRLLF